MGIYTEVSLRIRLRKDTPTEVVELLDNVVNNFSTFFSMLMGKESKVETWLSADTPNLPIEHEFGKCSRWTMFFHSNNFDPENIEGSFFDKDKLHLSVHTEFKNYEGEIQKFVDWIKPYVIGRKKKQYIGWYQVEDVPYRINLYIERL